MMTDANSMLIRRQSCLYYTPWLVMLELAVLAAGAGVWIWAGLDTIKYTNAALGALNVAALNSDIGKPAVIASACVALSLVVVILCLAIWREFIEKAHDTTGRPGSGGRGYLVVNSLVSFVWWLVVIWMVLLIEGSSLWALIVYIAQKGINHTLASLGTLPIPPTFQPTLPSAVCPPQCLDLSAFSFISSSFENSCVCNPSQLKAASQYFGDALNSCYYALGACWFMWAGATTLLVNLASSFSRISQQLDYIARLLLADKPQFSSA